MDFLIAVLLIIVLGIIVAFAAGYVMVAREQMVIDERIRRFTQ